MSRLIKSPLDKQSASYYINCNKYEAVTASDKGNDKEEYMTAAARENDLRLKGRFGRALWKVALEPVRRMAVCFGRIIPLDAAVSVHVLSPLTDRFG